MSRQKHHATLRLLLGSGIDVMAQMPVTSECLKRLIPSFSLSMIRVDAHCVPQQHYSEHFDEFSHRLFASSGHIFSARTDDPAAFRNLLHHPRPFGTLISTAPDFIAGATYQHLFKRNGIHHVLDVALRHANGPLGILGIFREEAAPRFTRTDVAEIATLYPWLIHAMAAEPMPTPHDELDTAMLIAGLDGRILWASPRARWWLEDASGGLERGLLVDRHQLPLACRTLCRSWEASQRRTPGRGESLAPPTLALPVPGGRLRLRAYALGHLESSERCLGIQLSLEMNRTLRLLRALEDSELPPQLRRMALAYWRGEDTASVAHALKLTAASVKSYRKELYARLEVNGADALRARLDTMADTVSFDLARHSPARLSSPSPRGGVEEVEPLGSLPTP
jgi:hypothetical protein